MAQLKELGIRSYSPLMTGMSLEYQNQMTAFLHNEEGLLDLLQKSKCFVCISGEQIIGMAYLIPKGHPSGMYKAEWAYIRKVGVDPAYQGKGIARHLMNRCIAHAKKFGEKILALHTSEAMPDAIHLYESLGFKIIQEIEPRYGLRYWLYTMDLV
jgi:ribosomal protein S18 acetylase RimI-like enzyme